MLCFSKVIHSLIKNSDSVALCPSAGCVAAIFITVSTRHSITVQVHIIHYRFLHRDNAIYKLSNNDLRRAAAAAHLSCTHFPNESIDANLYHLKETSSRGAVINLLLAAPWWFTCQIPICHTWITPANDWCRLINMKLLNNTMCSYNVLQYANKVAHTWVMCVWLWIFSGAQRPNAIKPTN